MFKENLLQTIGKTPLVRLNNIVASDGERRIYAKVELFNPGGSIKDRTAFYMIENAIKRGKIDQNTVIIEPTSGNTGIGLAVRCAVEKRRLVLTMPDTMSVERRKILSAYGAEIVLTEGKLGMAGAIKRAEELSREIKNSFIPSQFTNLDNRYAHEVTTAPEIFDDLPTTAFIVGGVGTGGTLGGIADYIKKQGKNAKIIAVEPYSSAVLSGEEKGAHNLQGIGAGFIPDIVNLDDFYKIFKVKDEDAYRYARRLAKEEGILAGITSGASLAAAVELSKEEKGDIVVILPDTGMRYLSTKLYE
ncbi:MAG: cysteine synthase A [Clostridia bacterium]|nr:cysteine synthase A [Clostridia bacterium]